MLQNVVTVGPLLAGTAAFLALILNLTRGTRLNHRERTLRESMAVLEANSTQRASVAGLHLQTVSEIVARQVCGKWRFWWPWLFMLFVAAGTADIAYSTVGYFKRGSEFDYLRYVSEVGGGDTIFLTFPFVVLFGSYFAVGAYRHSIFDRAKIAHSFCERGFVRPPTSYFQPGEERPRRSSNEVQKGVGGKKVTVREIAARVQRAALRFRREAFILAKFAAPGGSAAAIGALVGLRIAMQNIPVDERIPVLSAMSGATLIGLLVATASFVLTGWVWMDERAEFLAQFRTGVHPRHSLHIRT